MQRYFKKWFLFDDIYFNFWWIPISDREELEKHSKNWLLKGYAIIMVPVEASQVIEIQPFSFDIVCQLCKSLNSGFYLVNKTVYGMNSNILQLEWSNCRFWRRLFRMRCVFTWLATHIRLKFIFNYYIQIKILFILNFLRKISIFR